MNNKSVILLGIGCVLLLVIGYFMLREQVPEEVVSAPPSAVIEPVQRSPESTPVESSAEPEQAASKPKLIGPALSLAASHPLLIEIAQSLSPELVQWLVGDELLRKWVILIDQIADGQLSSKWLPIQYEMPAFAVDGTKDLATAAESNAARAEPLINAITDINPELLVAYYRLWQPLLDEAYAELGKPGKFDERVVQAIRQLQTVPAMPEDGRLAAKPVMYKYLNPAVEKAPALHKWMWRLGAENQARITNYLTQVKLELYKQS